VRLEVESRESGYVFLSEPFYPERIATVDGVRVTATKANLAFMLVPVPAGEHVVELRYEPTTLRLGTMVSLATAVSWWGLARWARRRGGLAARRNAGGTPP